MKAKETAKKALEMLHDLKNLCYSEKSNDIFDELHDDIYWQCVGLKESMDDCQTADDWEYLLNEWLDALKMAKDIKAYHKTLTETPPINWIYS